MRISPRGPSLGGIAKFGIGIWLFCFVLGLGGLVAAFCVAWHFLAKVW